MMLPALLLLSVLIAGCAIKQAVPIDCPRPEEPVLPELDPTLPLENPANIERLMERDDCIRLYILGLEACIECFRKTGGK